MKSVKSLFRPSTKQTAVKAPPPSLVQGTRQFLHGENERLKEELEEAQEEIVRLRLKLRAL